MDTPINQAVDVLRNSSSVVAFTGAGVSVESGVPPFRGENGIWNVYDADLFDIGYFMGHIEDAWKALTDAFYGRTKHATPNDAHCAIARLQEDGPITAVITQNIDDLHTKAGSKNVYELHGNGAWLICVNDATRYSIDQFDLTTPPRCEKCGAILKPDFVFFGEQLPADALEASIKAAETADAMLVIGSTGIVMPAASIPPMAKQHGAVMIEINPHKSEFTDDIIDIFIPMKACEAMREIEEGYRAKKKRKKR